MILVSRLLSISPHLEGEPMAVITCPQCGAKNRVDDRAQTLQPVCGRCGEPLPTAADTSHPLEVTDSTFATVVLKADKPVLLDCWAPWCGPCRMIAPTVDQLAAESAGRYLVAKLNTDQNPAVSANFRIDSIPTLLLFNKGQLVDRIVGLQSKAALSARLSAVGS
jgi:thioredoxin 2